MKKVKWIVAFLIVANLLLGVIGCKDPEIHIHTYSEAWTKDETNHWHAATCGHTTEVRGKAAHSFGDWTITNEPTEEAEGSREKSCTVCEYTVPEVIEKLAHTHKFATDWSKDETNHWHAATCGHEEEISDKAPHSYSEIWSKDASGHWHECICGKREDFAEHAYGVWKVQQEPTETQAGRNVRTCKDCGYVDSVVLQPAQQGFRFVKGGTITGTESWTPESDVFVSGRSLTIPDLIVSDHEVTRGEYETVMGKDPSTASAYDKNGTELTGDDVLNNPVNNVSWYDALVYCNTLSIKEDLTPCYSINGSTDPDVWGEVPTSSNSTWNAAICDFEANGYRLPTEAEWEWLARGGENYTYAGSNTVRDVAWYTSNTYDTGTREVKTKAPNGYGLYDMSGNVNEWCWDWYGSISSSSAADGATSGSSRVTRGGSWYNNAISASVSKRGDCIPYLRFNFLGFRVVRASSID